jgi:hypothetical protein
MTRREAEAKIEAELKRISASPAYQRDMETLLDEIASSPTTIQAARLTVVSVGFERRDGYRRVRSSNMTKELDAVVDAFLCGVQRRRAQHEHPKLREQLAGMMQRMDANGCNYLHRWGDPTDDVNKWDVKMRRDERDRRFSLDTVNGCPSGLYFDVAALHVRQLQDVPKDPRALPDDQFERLGRALDNLSGCRVCFKPSVEGKVLCENHVERWEKSGKEIGSLVVFVRWCDAERESLFQPVGRNASGMASACVCCGVIQGTNMGVSCCSMCAEAFQKFKGKVAVAGQLPDLPDEVFLRRYLNEVRNWWTRLVRHNSRITLRATHEHAAVCGMVFFNEALAYGEYGFDELDKFTDHINARLMGSLTESEHA